VDFEKCDTESGVGGGNFKTMMSYNHVALQQGCIDFFPYLQRYALDKDVIFVS
jgi:hypothetical protein